MSALTSKHQRFIAVGILAFVALVLWVGVATPLVDLFVGGDRNMPSAQVLRTYRRAAAARPALESQLSAQTKTELDIPGAIKGQNASLVAASLQAELKTMIEQSGGDIRSAQNLPPVVADGYEEIAIRYDLTLPMKSLQSLLYSIETHRPYLFIDHADIRSADTLGANTISIDTRLSIRWDIRTYRWAGSS